MQVKLLFVCILVLWRLNAFSQNTSATIPNQPDSFLFAIDSTYISDSLLADSVYVGRNKKGAFGLLDSLASDSTLRTILKPYQFILEPFIVKTTVRKNLPINKEIKVRVKQNAPWKFWVIVFIFLYIAFVRIANPNNFRVFMQSVFNLKLSDKIWDDQRSFFGFVILQLFAIYLFIASIFINNQLEVRNMLFTTNYFVQFILICIILLVIYILKFSLHALLGVLLKMNKLGVGFVSNTISVNNFLALVIFPFIIFTLYFNDFVWSSVISQTVIAIFFISVIYRLLRISLLSSRFFSFPKIYLFIYLCALEIVPWFVIIKFLNNLTI